MLLPSQNPIVWKQQLTTWFAIDETLILIQHDYKGELIGIGVKDMSDNKDISHVFNEKLVYMATNFGGSYPFHRYEPFISTYLPGDGNEGKTLLKKAMQSFSSEEAYEEQRNSFRDSQKKAFENLRKAMVRGCR